jgi:hypothetical protein
MILAPVASRNIIALVLEITPGSFYEEVAAASSTTSTNATATLNGVAPYSITWTTDNGNLTPFAPTAAATTFNFLGLNSLLDAEYANIEVTAEDGSGNSATGYYSVYVIRTG